jgi:hypothetical protein
MRHGSAIYFLPGESAKMLDWRGFCVVAERYFFLFPTAGGLTRKNVAFTQGRRGGQSVARKNGGRSEVLMRGFVRSRWA